MTRNWTCDSWYIIINRKGHVNGLHLRSLLVKELRRERLTFVIRISLISLPAVLQSAFHCISHVYIMVLLIRFGVGVGVVARTTGQQLGTRSPDWKPPDSTRTRSGALFQAILNDGFWVALGGRGHYAGVAIVSGRFLAHFDFHSLRRVESVYVA